MHSSSPGIQSKITTLVLALLLVTLWLLLRGYHGLTGDGQIYAFQALARLYPQLAADLYLQNTSQDQFTIFSPLYAGCIRLLNLENAARVLTLLFSAWFLAAAWALARTVAGRDAAWLAAAWVLIIGGDYGGSGVFRFFEIYLTARLPAEALVVTALACHVRGMKRTGLWLAVGALFVHPLIALPGLLLLVCLSLRGRVMLAGAIAGVVTALGIALAAAIFPAALPGLPVMDEAWLEVVRERSQFLFVQLWSLHDWSVNIQPFVYLTFTAIVLPDQRIRKLCFAAALVGAAGLALASIGSLIGPIAALVQGQAWRWVWITVFVSAVLLPATALEVWRDEKCGPLCVLLLVSGWTLPAVDGTACAALALTAWSVRAHVSARAAPCLRWACAALGAAIVAWILLKSWAIVSPSIVASGAAPLGAAQLRGIFELKVPAMLFGILVWWRARTGLTLWAPALLSALLAAMSLFILPAALRESRTFAAASDLKEFADWTQAIPPTSTVLVAPAQDVGAFVWFTLRRPNYLAADQSAGVVFSRATALEIQRRSQVLLPLMDPDWKILTSLRNRAALAKREAGAPARAPTRAPAPPVTRPLTAANLRQVCADPELGFVISRENVGFDPLRHEHAGAWKDWNLYDCRKVRLPAPAA
ncbi:MAG TPA: hypothetical protein VKG63_06145 [Steroidobacteraceae bacterium]|nr:hypothetical protein [Steroidobacteraceae bacterium]